MRVRAASLRWAMVPGLAMALLTAACDDDITAPEEEEILGQITVSTPTDSAFVALGDSATIVSGAAPWDIKFYQTAVYPRTTGTPVLALCLCQNAASTDEQFIAMTADSEKADFEAVTAAQIPVAGDPRWANDAFNTSRWYRYDIDPNNPNHIHPTFDVYLIKKGTAVYKLQILDYYNAAAESRHITFRYQRLVE